MELANMGGDGGPRRSVEVGVAVALVVRCLVLLLRSLGGERVERGWVVLGIHGRVGGLEVLFFLPDVPVQCTPFLCG